MGRVVNDVNLDEEVADNDGDGEAFAMFDKQEEGD